MKKVCIDFCQGSGIEIMDYITGKTPYMKSVSTITVNGSTVPVEADGIAQYKMKADGSPGKHNIPVKIQYSRLDGTSVFCDKVIQYAIRE